LRRARGLWTDATTKKGQLIEKSKKRGPLLEQASKQTRRKGGPIKESKRGLLIDETNPTKWPIEKSKRSTD